MKKKKYLIWWLFIPILTKSAELKGSFADSNDIMDIKKFDSIIPEIYKIIENGLGKIYPYLLVIATILFSIQIINILFNNYDGEDFKRFITKFLMGALYFTLFIFLFKNIQNGNFINNVYGLSEEIVEMISGTESVPPSKFLSYGLGIAGGILKKAFSFNSANPVEILREIVLILFTIFSVLFLIYQIFLITFQILFAYLSFFIPVSLATILLPLTLNDLTAKFYPLKNYIGVIMKNGIVLIASNALAVITLKVLVEQMSSLSTNGSYSEIATFVGAVYIIRHIFTKGVSVVSNAF